MDFTFLLRRSKRTSLLKTSGLRLYNCYVPENSGGFGGISGETPDNTKLEDKTEGDKKEDPLEKVELTRGELAELLALKAQRDSGALVPKENVQREILNNEALRASVDDKSTEKANRIASVMDKAKTYLSVALDSNNKTEHDYERDYAVKLAEKFGITGYTFGNAVDSAKDMKNVEVMVQQTNIFKSQHGSKDGGTESVDNTLIARAIRAGAK